MNFRSDEKTVVNMGKMLYDRVLIQTRSYSFFIVIKK